jgi:hypothetical protein
MDELGEIHVINLFAGWGAVVERRGFNRFAVFAP